MPKPVAIPTLEFGARVQETFLVLEVDQRTTGEGNPFTVLTVGNATGSIETEPFWLDRQPLVAGVRRGHVAQVIGEVESYRDRPQLKVTSLRILPADSVDVRSLLPSVGPIERYWETLDSWRAEIRKPRLKRVVDLFYTDADFRTRYEQCPASVRGHHAAVGGLLQHTTEVAAIARTIARASGADAELVLAGVLLHDIGKIESYRWDGIFDYTPAGSLVGHVVLGALMLDRRLGQEEPPPCTDLERGILLHLVLSHHGKLEFGSPVRPMTLEAEVLHWADNASAKTAGVAEALAHPANFPEGSPVSSSQRRLDGRRLFKGHADWGAG
ncbi:MAG: HD domain-containing protein [Gemmatimonadetes bacterium]|nr:HD domain-containing protein [Gemmatimonadota bacterium]